MCPTGAGGSFKIAAGDMDRLDPYENDGANSGRVMIHGFAYELGNFWEKHPNIGVENGEFAVSVTGKDLSYLFTRETPSCTNQPVFVCKLEVAVDGINGNPREHCHPQSTLDAYPTQAPTYFNWTDITRKDKFRFGYSGQVIDMKPYFFLKNTSVTGEGWLSPADEALVTRALRTDATHLFGASPERVKLANCLLEMYSVGVIEQDTFVCMTAQIIMWISLIIISATVILRFVLAIAFSWFLSWQLGKIRQRKWFSFNKKAGRVEMAQAGTGVTAATHPQSFSLFRKVDLSYRYRELYTMCLVTCYSEDEVGLRATMDSLSETDYNNEYKMIFVVADGVVKGAGNDKPTGDIVLDLITLDPVMHGPVTKEIVEDPETGKVTEKLHYRNGEPHSYIAIGGGSKRHNTAKVFCGTYESKGNRVAVVLVYKWGTPAEHEGGGKPGNRGKRDSQIVLMDFLAKIMFDEPMTPHQYDLFTKWSHIMTVQNGGRKRVTPDMFEIILMVDADTKVMPDSLSRMVAVMQRDPSVMGLCGETRISNKNESWVTMIQVFEYHISHHMVKAFESVFGGVTCLPYVS